VRGKNHNNKYWTIFLTSPSPILVEFGISNGDIHLNLISV